MTLSFSIYLLAAIKTELIPNGLMILFLPNRNHPVLPGVIGSPSQQRSNSGDFFFFLKSNKDQQWGKNMSLSVSFFWLGTSARPGDTEDYVADSEDEATKNFKVRVCFPKPLKDSVSMSSTNPYNVSNLVLFSKEI